MKTAQFTVVCNAVYKSELEIPDEVDTNDYEEVAAYIRDNLDKCSVEDLEWISDWENDAVTGEDITSIAEE